LTEGKNSKRCRVRTGSWRDPFNVGWQPARPGGARISGLITTGKIEHCHVVVAFDGGEDSGEGGLISA
jgi:hypothetical protein